ncbi:MAG: glycosyltransferase family 4 protein [Microcystis aeruginosa BS13-02]|jgi:glycosyltransferase involved in cell wall biosynthesis|uniref:glycosyltransferase family 4 protein n=1 Tax=Microcystis TaxID=1125 RepID=UPI00232E07A2|nr:glycosyltransferase family 4 protein [Microcystis aeruginosa]MDB9506655.1 glycosyltransferase family 4 protein [Microcystis aeruginosa CS-338/01]NCS24487.1 glycosyltransferase family 4 protein [Microcystis aeruginosa BS13-02]
MRILVLAWEFPPRLVGGIARHVAELYPEIVKLGHEVHLITIEFGQAPSYELVEGIHIHRVPVPPGNDFFHWVVNMNNSMGQEGGKIIAEYGKFDLVHAHDWLVGDAAIALKHLFKIPLIATIHATEYGRYNGLHTDTQRYIASKEGTLVYNAWRVIVCTSYMRHEVHRALGAPWDKIDVVYNGIRAEKKQRDPNFDYRAFRRQYAEDYQKIVYYVGRMTFEKGVSVLLNAAPKVLAHTEAKTKFVIIGGGNTDKLKQQSWHLGIWHHCYFTGFMSDENLDRFQTVADCAVFPSLYEPFGIVALESFAARVPVVVSDTCGFPEVVRHGQTGIVTRVNNPDSLAWGILEVLNHPEYAHELANNAYKDLEKRFHWANLARQTETVYGLVVQERQLVEWR